MRALTLVLLALAAGGASARGGSRNAIVPGVFVSSPVVAVQPVVQPYYVQPVRAFVFFFAASFVSEGRRGRLRGGRSCPHAHVPTLPSARTRAARSSRRMPPPAHTQHTTHNAQHSTHNAQRTTQKTKK
jgi:hypothetical protein